MSMDHARVAKDIDSNNSSISEDEIPESSGDGPITRRRRQAVSVVIGTKEALQGNTVDRVCEANPLDTCLLDGECVTSVELCECPDGYHGFSCEDCSVGYYRR